MLVGAGGDRLIENTHLSKLKIFGGDSAEETPLPIPNRAVKLRSADGTILVTVWESRSPPRSVADASQDDFLRGVVRL